MTNAIVVFVIDLLVSVGHILLGLTAQEFLYGFTILAVSQFLELPVECSYIGMAFVVMGVIRSLEESGSYSEYGKRITSSASGLKFRRRHSSTYTSKSPFNSDGSINKPPSSSSRPLSSGSGRLPSSSSSRPPTRTTPPSSPFGRAPGQALASVNDDVDEDDDDL